MQKRDMDLLTALRVLRRRWWLLVLAVGIAAVPTYLVSRSFPKVYEADTTLLVGLGLPGTSPDYQQLLVSQQLSRTYSSLATTGPVLEAVKAELGLEMDLAALRGSVEATAPVDSSLITIKVFDDEPVRAAEIADALAQELISRSPAISSDDPAVARIVIDQLNSGLQSVQQQISASQAEITRLAGIDEPTPDEAAQLAALRARLPDLQQAYAKILGFTSGGGGNILTVIDPAEVPTQPVSPRVALNTLIVAMLALINAIALAFLLEYLDDTLKSSDDVEAVTGLPTIGTIVRMRLGRGRGPIYGLATLLYPRGPAAEAYRTLRTNVDFSDVDNPMRAILVTSAERNEGKTTTAANLAVAIAQAGRYTILLDADLRRPGVHQMFDLPNDEGLTSVLRPERATVERVAKATEEPNLRVITTGPLPPSPVDLLASRRMARLLEALVEQADVVVIDSPPLGVFSDAAILSTLVDGTVLVVSAGQTRGKAVRSAARKLASRGGRTLGVVLNRLSQHDSDGYGYDSYVHQDGPKTVAATAVAEEHATRRPDPGPRRPDTTPSPSPGDVRS